LQNFYRNYLCADTFKAWRDYTKKRLDEIGMDDLGSPTTSTRPIPIEIENVDNETPLGKVGSNPDYRVKDPRVSIPVQRPHSYPSILPDIRPPRPGKKRDSPGLLASPSKRSCVMLEKLKLGSPLANSTSNPRFSYDSSHSQRSMNTDSTSRSSNIDAEFRGRKTFSLPGAVRTSAPDTKLNPTDGRPTGSVLGSISGANNKMCGKNQRDKHLPPKIPIGIPPKSFIGFQVNQEPKFNRSSLQSWST